MNLMEAEMMARAGGLQDQLVAWRRHFHMWPERSFEEWETIAYLEQQLQAWNLQPVRRTQTGLWVDITPAATGMVSEAGGTSGEPKPLVAVRADMDALPIREQSAVAYGSRKEGLMHACGHDGHTAILLGVARILSEMRDRLPGRVRLIFQHAEEQPPGGAQELIREGVLANVGAIIGLHLWTPLPAGKAALSAGPVMANADSFSIRITGRGGHAAMPHDTVDALACAAHLTTALQQVVSRNVNPLRPAVLTIGTFQAGTNFNVIAQNAELTGTVRTFDLETRNRIRDIMARMVEDGAHAFGANGMLNYEEGYPALVNHPQVTELMRRLICDAMGSEALVDQEAFMGGEDFARYLELKPGAFLFLGAGNGEQANYPHHHPCFDIDERVLCSGTGLLACGAWRLLESVIESKRI